MLPLSVPLIRIIQRGILCLLLLVSFSGFLEAHGEETEHGLGWSQTQIEPEGGVAAPAIIWTPVVDRVDELWNQSLYAIDGEFVRVGQLLLVLIVFLTLLVVAWIVRSLVRRILRRKSDDLEVTSESTLKRSVLTVIRRTQKLFVVLLAAYLALLVLPLSPTLGNLLHALAIIVVTTQVAIWASAVVHDLIERTMQRRAATDPSAASALGLMGFFSRVAIWSIALLLVLTNLDYEIGPLLAGLGVGGIAVAIALQSILDDLFCSVAIVLDKPFVLGDFIIVGDMLGTVEHIGIKTTRVRSLAGEQIIFSNADLLGSRIRNYKRMTQRRVVFSFGVLYETPLDTLAEIPNTVRRIIEGIDQTQFDRAHFHEFGDFSLNFEVVYYVRVADYNIYMDIQQQINLELFQAFQQAGISFAYPTRELIIRPTAQENAAAAPLPTPTPASSGD